MFEFLNPAWVHQLVVSYGLIILFCVLMFEAIGVPLPGESALIASALYVGSTHAFSIFDVVAVAAAAAIIGDNIGYVIGRTIGHKLLARYGYLIKLTDARLRIGEYLFLRHGGKIVFFGRFIAFFRTVTALLAGANQMHWRHFLIMNVLGGICWASMFGFGSYLLGEQIHRIAGPVGFALVALAVIVVVGSAMFIRRHEKDLERKAEIALAAEHANS